MSDSAGEPVTSELDTLRTELRNSVPLETIDRLVRAAMRAGARRLLEVLDLEGTIAPCGQGCGWEGPWAIDSTLWPADRERLLGQVFVPSAQAAEVEKRRRLLGSGLGTPQ